MDSVKHAEAFEHYYTKTHQGMSKNASIMSVAGKCNVDERTVYRWYKKYNWKQKKAIRDIKLLKKLQEITDNTILENKAKYLSIAHLSLNKYLDDIESGLCDPISVKSLKDLERVIELCLSIQLENTSKTDVGVVHPYFVDVEERLERLRKLSY